jgi:hypothetical protein
MFMEFYLEYWNGKIDHPNASAIVKINFYFLYLSEKM